MPGNLQRATLWLLDQVSPPSRLIQLRIPPILTPSHGLTTAQTHIVVTGITALTFLKTRSAHVGYFIAGAVLFNTFG